MITNITELPLYTDLSYRYSIALEGQSWQLKFYWNQRQKQWHMDIRQEDQTPIVLGHALVPQYPMLEDLTLEIYGLTGRFLLMPVNVAVAPQVTLGSSIVPEFFKLFYTYESET